MGPSSIIVVVVLCFVAGSLSAEVKPCCLPKQWSANIVETIGEYNRDLDVASLAYVNADYFYDSVGQQIALREDRDNQTSKIKSHRRIIMKFSQGMQFVIENNTCTPSKLDKHMTPPCIPDDATHFGTHSYPLGIQADVWFFYDTVTVMGGQKRLTVTSQTCMPLTLSYISGGPDYILTTSLYQNVTQGITDPTVFNVPSFCNPRLLSKVIQGNKADKGVVEMEMH